MYVFDTNVFLSLREFYRSRFPTIWNKIDSLADNNQLLSVREVRNELDRLCSTKHIIEWIENYRDIFIIPTDLECFEVSKLLEVEQYRGLVKQENIKRGFAVADPFLIAVAKIRNGTLVTQEKSSKGAARIPTICKDFDISCTNLEGFFDLEDIGY